MAYTTIPAGQDGSALNPYLSRSDPSSSPGFAAEVYAILKDQITGTLYQKTGTADTAWEPITGSTSYKTDEEYYKFRAQSLMGSPRLTSWWWSDLLEPLGEEFTASMGTGSTYTTKNNACGVGTMTVATSGSDCYLFVGNEVNAPGNAIPGGASGSWYVATRLKVNQLIGGAAGISAAMVGIDCLNSLSTGVLSFGAVNPFYPTSATYGICDDRGATMSTTAFSTAEQVWECCRSGGTTTLYINEAPVASGDRYHGSAAGEVYVRTANSSTSALPTITNIDFLCFAVGGNNPRTIT